MTARAALKLLFTLILVAMLAVTAKASFEQPVWAWGGLVHEPDRWWTWATLADAYSGFLTFYAWVFYKERGAAGRGAWFVAIMLLGNIAMSSYVLWQLSKLGDDEPLESLLLRK